MKTLKSILIAATLICASAVTTMSAQQAAESAQPQQPKLAVGDSVMIRRECTKYLTGETPSTWVWDKVHTVHQIGTKRNPNRYPNGILLWKIRSWVCDSCITVVNGHAEEAAQKAAEEQSAEREAWEQAKKENADAEAAAARVAEEKAAREAAERAALEEARRLAEEQAAAEAKAAAEQAKADSIQSAQKFKGSYDRFTIGLRGGIASQLHQAVQGVDAKWGIGGDVLLDLQYAHYWTKDGRSTDLGLIVGLSAGYAQGSFKGSENSTFTKGNLDYTVQADGINETDHQIQLEVPLMFSLIHQSGLFFNVGPRFMIPVYTPYKQTINSATAAISAYDPATGVTLQDNVVTGKYIDQQPAEANGLQFKLNIMLTAEIGYEWILKSGNSLGLGVYADYSVYNTRSKLNAAASESLLNITPPSDSGIATLEMLSATSTYAKSVGYFDLGVKLAYHFNFPKKRSNIDAKLF